MCRVKRLQCVRFVVDWVDSGVGVSPEEVCAGRGWPGRRQRGAGCGSSPRTGYDRPIAPRYKNHVDQLQRSRNLCGAQQCAPYRDTAAGSSSRPQRMGVDQWIQSRSSGVYEALRVPVDGNVPGSRVNAVGSTDSCRSLQNINASDHWQ